MKKRIALLMLILMASLAGATLPVAASALGDDKRGAGQGGATVSLGGVESRAPADWKQQETSGQMRAYQFQIPKAEGDKSDAELVIFYFGEGGAGGVSANVNRWKEMFIPPEGKNIDDVAKLDTFKVGDAEVTYLDIQGTYKFKARPFDPNARVELKPDYRMVGVVFGSKKGPYFLRLVGPAKTVGQQKKAFDDWLKAFK